MRNKSWIYLIQVKTTLKSLEYDIEDNCYITYGEKHHIEIRKDMFYHCNLVIFMIEIAIKYIQKLPLVSQLTEAVELVVISFNICRWWKIYADDGKYMLAMKNICRWWKIYAGDWKYMQVIENTCSWLKINAGDEKYM